MQILRRIVRPCCSKVIHYETDPVVAYDGPNRPARDGRSLREMFGGTREKVEVGVSIGIQPSAPALVRTEESYLDQGCRRVKIKIKPGREVDETCAVRRASPTCGCRWMPTPPIPWRAHRC